MRSRSAPGAALAAILAIAACSRAGDGAPREVDDGEALIQEQERGPVKVILRVAPKEVSIADRIRFRITAEARPGVRVTLPEFGESLGAFSVRDWRVFPERGEDPRIFEQEYTLDILVSGEYPIPPLTVRFVDEREDSEHPGREFEIQTEEIVLSVRSLVEGDPRLAEIREIAGPVSFPEEGPGPLPFAVAGAVVLVIALALFLRLRRKRRIEERARLAHQIAFDELEALVAMDLVGKGRVSEFYFHLSGALRRYIENRFRLRAPERTTEEFLREMTGATVFESNHGRLLREFLEKADLVKFARHEPPPGEIEASFDFARDFVTETRQREKEAA